MAAPERNGGVVQGSMFDQGEAAVGSGTLLSPQTDTVEAEFGGAVPERPLEEAAAGPGSALGEEAGKAAEEEMPAGPRVVEAAVSGQEGPEASGFSPAASVSSPGSLLPPGPGLPRNAAQRLQDVAQRVALQQGKSGEAAVALTRLLPPKQLETLCVQVQPEKTKEKDKSALGPAVIHPKSVMIAQPVEKNAKILGLGVYPQIVQIHPAMGAESQQFFLHNSSEPTVQFLLQSPLHPLGQTSVVKMTTHGKKKKPAALAPADSPNGAVISANLLINHEKKRKEQKIKKSLKVKTRSGRISRPPKYKAKDYKFIKTEDLADCHKSDSDDYSELSLEDDEGGRETGACSLFDSLEYNLRPKLFKCKNCEKSYIGQGGLARHYKLNPDHGQQEPSQSSLINRPYQKTSLEYTGKRSSERIHHSFLPSPIPVALVNKNEIDIELEKDLKEDGRQSETSAEDRKSAEQLSSCLLHSGCGRARQRRRHGQPKWTERSRYSGRFSRPGQFTSRCHNNIPSEHHSIFRRKARLNELIQLCTNEDFMELAVPRFTKLVTVFEFLLMKVEQKYQKKALFPDVYQEFELLHAMVKKMCQDYFGNPDLNKSVEIKNPKVAESLGITDSFLVVQKTQADCSPEFIKTTGDNAFIKNMGQKCAAESSDEMLPLAKKSRVEHLLENMNDYSNHSGVKEGSSTYKEGSCVANVQPGNALWEEEHELLEEEIANDRAGLDLYDQNTQVRLERKQPPRKSELGCSGCLSPWHETLPADSAVSSEDKLMQANSSWGTGNEVTLSSGSP